MLSPADQARVLRSIAEAAAKRGLYVAPVGSRFPSRGKGKASLATAIPRALPRT